MSHFHLSDPGCILQFLHHGHSDGGTMRRYVIAATFFVVIITLSAAQGVMVDYLEGKASQRANGAWSLLSIGDTVPLDGSVKLEEHSMLQLKGQGASFTISQPGTYGLRSLANARAALRAAGAGAAVAVAFTGWSAAPRTSAARRAASRGDDRHQGLWVSRKKAHGLSGSRETVPRRRAVRAGDRAAQAGHGRR